MRRCLQSERSSRSDAARCSHKLAFLKDRTPCLGSSSGSAPPLVLQLCSDSTAADNDLMGLCPSVANGFLLYFGWLAYR